MITKSEKQYIIKKLQKITESIKRLEMEIECFEYIIADDESFKEFLEQKKAMKEEEKI